MNAEEQDQTDQPETSGDANDLPPIEDASIVDEPAPDDDAVVEDDPEALVLAARSLESETEEANGSEAPATPPDAQVAVPDDTSDTDRITDDEKRAPVGAARHEHHNWSEELSAQKIAVELRRIETEVRQRLEGRDIRRKRKLAGSRRWRELEEDIIAWRHTGKIDEPTLNRLHELVGRRHYLFRRLTFLAGTRPTWNS